MKDTQNKDNVNRQFRGDNAAKHFMRSIKEDLFKIADILYSDRQMEPVLTPDEQAAFDTTTVCYLCKHGEFTPESPKVRDHVHATPFLYRGPAHKNCNLKF